MTGVHRQHDRTGQRAFRHNRFCSVRARRGVEAERVCEDGKQSDVVHAFHAVVAQVDVRRNVDRSLGRERFVQVVDVDSGVHRRAVRRDRVRIDAAFADRQIMLRRIIADGIIAVLAEALDALLAAPAEAHAVIGMQTNVEDDRAAVGQDLLDLGTDAAHPAPVFFGVRGLPVRFAQAIELVIILQFGEHLNRIAAGLRLCGRDRMFDVGDRLLRLLARVPVMDHVGVRRMIVVPDDRGRRHRRACNEKRRRNGNRDPCLFVESDRSVRICATFACRFRADRFQRILHPSVERRGHFGNGVRNPIVVLFHVMHPPVSTVMIPLRGRSAT